MNWLSRIKRALMLAACALAVAGCAVAPTTPTPIATTPAGATPAPLYGRSTGEVRTPITVLLILSHAPLLNEPAEVTLLITSTLDAPGASAEILLPPGAAATEGALTWTGDLKALQPQRLQATVTFVQEGDWTLGGKALRPAGGRDVWGDMAVIYLHVTREASQVGFPNQPNVPHDGGQVPPPALSPAAP